ncbi:MAG: hypothetical protein ACK5LK_02985 [Chthoniobacterales bacterium]
MINRSRIFWGIGAVIAVFFLLRFVFSGSGISVNYEKVPLQTVLQQLSKKLDVPLESNLPPDTPVTLHLKNISKADLIDTLAVRLDASWQLAYVMAPEKSQIDALFTAYREKQNLEKGWLSFGGNNRGGQFLTTEISDPQLDEWTVEKVETGDLPGYLNQGSQKTRALFAIAPEWTPSVTQVPKSDVVGKVAAQLAKATGGEVREIILISERGWRGGQGDRENTDRGNRPPPSEGRERRLRDAVFAMERGERNETWENEKLAQITRDLPAAERKEVLEEAQNMRKIWSELRELPPEERRKKIEELMQDPKMQERMEEMRDLRDSKRTPEQRMERSRRYLDRKMKAREESGRPMKRDE